MNNNSLTTTENHAQTIIQTQYDGQIGAGYLRFCDCATGRTESFMDETSHQMLCDWDTTGTHIVGLEILNLPIGKLQQRPLYSDLARTQLTDKQKEAVVGRFIP